MIRIGIIDDQEIFRQGMKMILSSQDGMEVVGEGATGLEGYRLCEKHALDLLLMDIRMPVMDGVEATRRIKRDFPHVAVIVLTTFDEDEYIFQALKYGASGYLLKDAPPAKITEAVREVQGGGAPMQPQIAARVVERFRNLDSETGEVDPRIKSLTARERDIMQLLGGGKNNREIADELFITEGTVKNHISSILIKIGLRDRTQLAIFAVKNKIL